MRRKIVEDENSFTPQVPAYAPLDPTEQASEPTWGPEDVYFAGQGAVALGKLGLAGAKAAYPNIQRLASSIGKDTEALVGNEIGAIGKNVVGTSDEASAVASNLNKTAQDQFRNPLIKNQNEANILANVAKETERKKIALEEELSKLPDYSKDMTVKNQQFADDLIKNQDEIPTSVNKVADDFAEAPTKDIPIAENQAWVDFMKKEPSPEDITKLDNAIKEIKPTLYEQFKALPPSQKMAVAASMGFGIKGIQGLMPQGTTGASPKQEATTPTPKEEQPPTLPAGGKVGTPQAGTQPQDPGIQDPMQAAINKLQEQRKRDFNKQEQLFKSFKVDGSNIGTDAELREAQGKRDRERAMNTFGRAADTLSGSLLHTGNKLDKFYDEQDKFAERHVDDLKARIENQHNDPASQVSSAYRGILNQMGIQVPDTIAGSALSKALPQIKDIYLKMEQAQNRMDELQLKGAQAKVDKIQKDEDKREKENNDFIYKANKDLSNSKQYDLYTKASKALAGSKYALANPSAITDITQLYDLVKGLDPTSAVREGEVHLAREAVGLWGDLALKLKQASSNPRLLNQKVISDIHRYLMFVERDAKEGYNKISQPKLKQAKSRGINEDRYDQIDPIYSASKPTQYQAGDIVEYKGKKYKVGSDGDTLEEMK